ncbi:hypothetical protein [Nostoc piscinale]|uniref:hypothetical protein n=1 Tax=Nostoc piscinale TaxID=224012 RepID=UPI000A6FC7DC|nr:hypothetical protein [Nostoc piscinale]
MATFGDLGWGKAEANTSEFADWAGAALPDKSAWLRRVITEAAFKEGSCSEES